MIEVTLTWAEILTAAEIGVRRRVNGLRLKRAEPYGQRASTTWNHDINGALAEMALAKHLDRFWSGTIGQISEADVGALEVRSKCEPWHRLVIRATDPPDKIYVSVLVGIPVCQLCGWMRASDAKRPEWLLPDEDKPDRFFVPADQLESMENLDLAPQWLAP
jgi:putative component of toxin-antitoxin plasmid stabilization module